MAEMAIRATRRPGTIEAMVNGDLIGRHIDEGHFYGFNTSATRIWALIEEPCTVSELCALLASDYCVSPEDCIDDVVALCRDMAANGLVDLDPPLR